MLNQEGENMRLQKPIKLIAIILALLVFVSGVVFAQGSGDGGRKFAARLAGVNEVPAVTTDTSGRAIIKFNKTFTEAEFSLNVRKGVRITQAHIHCGAAGVNGPIIVFLAGFHAPGWDVDGNWINNTTVTNANVVNTTSACGSTLADLAQAMRDGNMYVNAHSVTNPGGEVRGQLAAGGDDD
jgi:hypothetical protein